MDLVRRAWLQAIDEETNRRALRVYLGDEPKSAENSDARAFRASLARFPVFPPGRARRTRLERMCGFIGLALLIAGMVGIMVLFVVAGAGSIR